MSLSLRMPRISLLPPILGDKLLTTIEDNTDDALYKKICRALAPFALALATDEMSINFGESGHTVVRSESVAPASDAKIAKAEGSLFSRAWQNLDKAIDYVIKHKADYSDWEEAEFSRHMKTALFSNARDFQEKGLVDIEYSPLTFHHLRMLILRIEISETMKLLPAAFRAEHSADPSAMPASILSALQGYTGSRVASHTSQITRTQRSPERERTEFSPLIRPSMMMLRIQVIISPGRQIFGGRLFLQHSQMLRSLHRTIVQLNGILLTNEYLSRMQPDQSDEKDSNSG